MTCLLCDILALTSRCFKQRCQRGVLTCMHCGCAQPIPLRDLLKDAKPADFWAEGLAVALMLYYTVNIFLGGRQNKRLATSWLDEYAGEGRLLQRSFSHVGLGACIGLGAVRCAGALKLRCMHTVPTTHQRHCHIAPPCCCRGSRGEEDDDGQGGRRLLPVHAEPVRPCPGWHCACMLPWRAHSASPGGMHAAITACEAQPPGGACMHVMRHVAAMPCLPCPMRAGCTRQGGGTAAA